MVDLTHTLAHISFNREAHGSFSSGGGHGAHRRGRGRKVSFLEAERQRLAAEEFAAAQMHVAPHAAAATATSRQGASGGFGACDRIG